MVRPWHDRALAWTWALDLAVLHPTSSLPAEVSRPFSPLGATLTHTFTPLERDLIRRQFGSGWGEPRRLSEGLWLHRWASGPNKGQPKLGKAVQSLLARGLVEIVDPERGLPSAQFTAAGLEALRAMAADARQLDPGRFGHLLEDLRRGG